jgi:hypothetical protein
MEKRVFLAKKAPFIDHVVGIKEIQHEKARKDVSVKVGSDESLVHAPFQGFRMRFQEGPQANPARRRHARRPHRGHFWRFFTQKGALESSRRMIILGKFDFAVQTYDFAYQFYGQYGQPRLRLFEPFRAPFRPTFLHFCDALLLLKK